MFRWHGGRFKDGYHILIARWTVNQITPSERRVPIICSLCFPSSPSFVALPCSIAIWGSSLAVGCEGGLDPSVSGFQRTRDHATQSQKSQLTSRGEPHHAPGLQHTGRSGEKHALMLLFPFPLRYYLSGRHPSFPTLIGGMGLSPRRAFDADSSEATPVR